MSCYKLIVSSQSLCLSNDDHLYTRCFNLVFKWTVLWEKQLLLYLGMASVWKSIAPKAANSRQLVHEGGSVFSSWNISRHRNHSPTRNTTFVLKIPLLNMTRSHSQATHLTPRECGHRHVLLWAASVSQHSVKLKLGEGRYGPCRYSVLPNPDCWSLVACLR